MRRRPPHGFPDLKPGDHVCHIYETDQERVDVLAETLQLGLNRSEAVMRLSDFETSRLEKQRLIDMGVDDGGTWITPDDTPLKNGKFKPDAIISWWKSTLSRSLKAGRSGLRLICDMSWIIDLAPSRDELLSFAAKANEFIPDSPFMAVCQFDRRRLPPDILLDALRTHPIVIVGREIHANSHYVPPEGLLGENSVKLELDRWLADLEREDKTQSELNELEKRQRDLFMNSRDGLVLMDVNGRIIDANPAYCEMLGYTLDELRQMDDVHKITPKRWRTWEREEILEKRLKRDGLSDVFEKEYVRKDGTIFPVELQAYGFFDELGNIKFIWGVARDITKRKKMETTLRRNEEDLRVTLRSIGDGVIATDTEGRVTRMNPVAETLTGWSLDEARGRPLREVFKIINANTRQPCEDPTAKVLKSGEEVGLANHTVLIAKDGTERQIADAGTPIRDDTDAISGVVLVFRDVTEEYAVRRSLEENEARYRELFERMRECVAVYEPVNDGEDFVFKDFNYAAEEIDLKKRKDILGQRVTNVFPNVEEFGLLDVFRDVHKTGLTRHHPVTLYHDEQLKGWRENWIYKLPSGEIVAIYQDVTARKQDEARIKHLNQVLRAIRNVNQLITHEKDKTTLINSACRELVESRGYHNALIVLTDESGRPLEVAGAGDDEKIKAVKNRTVENKMPPCCVKTLSDENDDVLISRESDCGDCPLAAAGRATMSTRLSHDGVTFGCLAISINLDFIENKDETNLFQEVADDISFALHAIELEAKQKTDNERLRFQASLLDQIQDRITATDLDGRIIYVNRTECQAFGKSEDQLIGQSVESYGEDPKRGATQRDIIETTKNEGAWRGEVVNFTADGNEMFLDSRTQLVRDEKGAPIALIGISTDVTEKKRADAEMRRLRHFLANIINSMPSLLIGVNSEGGVTEWNQQAEKTTNIPAAKAIGKSIIDAMPQMAELLTVIKESAKTRQARFLGKRKRKIDGEIRYEDVTIFPLIGDQEEGAVIRVDDVTERVRLENMMVQSEKMMSIDGLAAGMAHEINNPLGGMMQNAEVIHNRMTTDSPANEKAAAEAGTSMSAIRRFLETRQVLRQLTLIRESGRRAADIVENMLNFARRDETNASQRDLRELLDKTVELARNDYDLKKKYDFRDMEIVREYDPNLPAVCCESGKMQQVFLNLLRNAAEALNEMKSATGKPESPKITLRAEVEDDMVRLEVADNGPGIAEEVKRRLFEPFFTTKTVGKGTGLGLSVSYFIITENHGGEMWVESDPGEGTTFIMRLPIARKHT